MTLDDEQIERYSRQVILAEVGPRGQERLGAARVAVVGDGVAAGRVVAYLGAAGVGWIAASAALHAVTDPAQPDLTLASLLDAEAGRLDAVIINARLVPEAADDALTWAPRATSTFWIADGHAGGVPPCPTCATAAAPTTTVLAELATLRDALLGTVVATEVVKALLAIGTPLAGRVLAYDPETATVTNVAAVARPDCACRRSER